MVLETERRDRKLNLKLNPREHMKEEPKVPKGQGTNGRHPRGGPEGPEGVGPRGWPKGPGGLDPRGVHQLPLT